MLAPRLRHGTISEVQCRKERNFIDSSHRIASSEHIYQIGVSVQLSTMLLALWLAISLYAALRPANRNLALAAFSFRLSEVVLGAMLTRSKYKTTE
jgi:hypothetical protein